MVAQQGMVVPEMRIMPSERGQLTYETRASPEVLVRSIGALRDSVTSIRGQSFVMRTPSGFFAGPRVLVLQGRVCPSADGARLIAQFEYRALAQVARFAYLAFLAAIILISIPGAAVEPRVLVLPAVVALVVMLLLIPFEFVALRERGRLRAQLDEVMSSVGGAHSSDG